jgi:hypothetical protein
LNALQEHDEELVDIIRELKQDKGEGKPFNPKRLLEKVEFIGPQVGFDELVNSIAVEIMDRLGTSWDEWFGRVMAYLEDNDRPPLIGSPKKRAQKGITLADWCGQQRTLYNLGRLLTDRIIRLSQLRGWSWDVVRDRLIRNANALKDWCSENKTWAIPDRGATLDDVNISYVAKAMKNSYANGKIIATERRNTYLAPLDPDDETKI